MLGLVAKAKSNSPDPEPNPINPFLYLCVLGPAPAPRREEVTDETMDLKRDDIFPSSLYYYFLLVGVWGLLVTRRVVQHDLVARVVCD